MTSAQPYRLLTPGPVPIPARVREALAEPVLHHRTPEFERILSEVFQGLKNVFRTHCPVLIHPSTGSGAMEAAIVNTLSPGDEVLCVISGKFGERWAYMCEVYGLKVERFEVPWGEAVDLEKFEDLIKNHAPFKAVLSQVCETSTATVHPVREMSRIVHQYSQALFMVDAITAMGCMTLPMDEWELDVVVAGSQKAFMLPTGLSFAGVSERAWRAADKVLQPRFYFDWQHEVKANEKGQTYFSSPGTLIVGLHAVLKEFERVGLETVVRRCEALASVTRKAALSLGLKIYSKSPSSSVTALSLPEGVPGEKLRDWLESERRITVMGGQDQLKGQILRLGHMGDITFDDMRAFFEALAQGLDTFKPDLKANSKLPQALKDLEMLKDVPRAFA